MKNDPAGDEILLTGDGAPSAICVPWQWLAARTGAVLAPCGLTETGELDLEDFSKTSTEPVVSVVQISRHPGLPHPIEAIARLSTAGALLLVECLPKPCRNLPVNVTALGLFVGGLLQQALRPTGMGFPSGAGGAARRRCAPFQWWGENDPRTFTSRAELGRLPHKSKRTPRSVRPWVMGAPGTNLQPSASIASTAGSRHSAGPAVRALAGD